MQSLKNVQRHQASSHGVPMTMGGHGGGKTASAERHGLRDFIAIRKPSYARALCSRVLLWLFSIALLALKRQKLSGML
jgi:hypothetical protein